jgi:hypothetical protein
MVTAKADYEKEGRTDRYDSAAAKYGEDLRANGRGTTPEAEMVKKTIWTAVRMYADRNEYAHISLARKAPEQRIAKIQRLVKDGLVKTWLEYSNLPENPRERCWRLNLSKRLFTGNMTHLRMPLPLYSAALTYFHSSPSTPNCLTSR